VTATLGEGRAVGAYSLGLGYLNSDASREMDDLISALHKLGDDYAQVLNVAISGSDMASLKSAAQISRDSLADASQVFEDDIIMANSLDGAWDVFFDRISAEIDKTYAFDRAVFSYLDSRLDERLGQNERAMFI
jgi:methyl-accepting chemotaxis protein